MRELTKYTHYTALLTMWSWWPSGLRRSIQEIGASAKAWVRILLTTFFILVFIFSLLFKNSIGYFYFCCLLMRQPIFFLFFVFIVFVFVVLHHYARHGPIKQPVFYFSLNMLIYVLDSSFIRASWVMGISQHVIASFRCMREITKYIHYIAHLLCSNNGRAV